MKSGFENTVLLLAFWLGMTTSSAMAAAAEVPQPLPWTTATWAQQAKAGPRPAAYLFTTSYCSTCPDAFDVVARASAASGQKVALIPVMMDVTGPKAQRHAAYFPGLTALYAFDGFEPAIRQSIDPAWPNVTPFIVLVDRQGKMQRTIGPPDRRMLDAWLK
jgi:hypothetical protein